MNCQGILQCVREILTFGKIDERRHGISHNVRENDHFRQHDSPVSMYIDKLAKSRLGKFLKSVLFQIVSLWTLDCFVDITILTRVAYFEICSLEPVTFVVTFCQGNMNTVREMSGKCQGILEKPVAMNPAGTKPNFLAKFWLPTLVSFFVICM